MKSLRLPALALLLAGAAVVVVAGSQLTHPAGPAPHVSSGILATATPARALNTFMPPTRAPWPTPTAVRSTRTPVANARLQEPAAADNPDRTATTEAWIMTGTGVAIVKSSITAMSSLTSCHFLFMATYLEAEGNVIYSDPPREVDTITERKGETQTQRMIMIIGGAAWDYKDGQWVTHQSTDFLDPIHLSSVCRSIFDHVATADNLGYSNLNGHPVYHLAVTYPSGSSSVADAWIDSATRYVYLYQAHSGNGSDSIEYTIKFSGFNDPSIKIAPP